MSELQRPKESFGTRIGVILAVTGSAVGLGNFLRFPGLAAEYGGAFMVPYVVAFLLLGLPIAISEWGLGRRGGRFGFNSTPGVFHAITNRSRTGAYFGVLGPLIPVMIYMYYVFVEAWCLGYAWQYLTGGMTEVKTADQSESFFHVFTGIAGDGTLFDDPMKNATIFLAICFALNFYLIYRGLSKGIELFCKIAMPTLIVCAILVLIRVLTLPVDPAAPDQTVINGLGYMFNPYTEGRGFWESLNPRHNSEMWLAAAGQIFFSLSVGFGIIITYASYLKKDDDIALSSVTAAAGNGFCEVCLGGLIVIPAAFVMLGPSVVQNPPGTFGLGFVTLPQVFDAMPLGRWIGFIFFFLLFLAAATSSISMLQPAIAFLEESLGVGRRASMAILGFITVCGAWFVMYFSAGAKGVDTIDFWIGTVGIYTLATIQVIMFGWVLGIRKGKEEIDRGAEIPIPFFVLVIVKFISPLYLLAVFGFWAYTNFYANYVDPEKTENTALYALMHDRTAQFSVGLILLMIVFLVLVISEAVRRWDRLEASQKGAEL
ncbi:sodium-dependent transporter [Poriferisphaera sp. WC338]|uniref:sodium-dependent transporter n=1 Tax=Poriferisphaera sp. WC338 TaxID=3425129 RepID=UPI003D818969